MTTKTLQGTLTGLFENERSDSAILDKSQRITLKKGTAKDLAEWKGKVVKVTAKENLFNGRKTYISEGVELVGDAVDVGGSSNTGYMGHSTGGEYSNQRQQSIVFQSMVKVAAEIEIHNATIGKREVDMKNVLRCGFSLARLAYNPDLFKPNPNNQTTETSSSVEDVDSSAI